MFCWINLTSLKIEHNGVFFVPAALFFLSAFIVASYILFTIICNLTVKLLTIYQKKLHSMLQYWFIFHKFVTLNVWYHRVMTWVFYVCFYDNQKIIHLIVRIRIMHEHFDRANKNFNFFDALVKCLYIMLWNEVSWYCFPCYHCVNSKYSIAQFDGKWTL